MFPTGLNLTQAWMQAGSLCEIRGHCVKAAVRLPWKFGQMSCVIQYAAWGCARSCFQMAKVTSPHSKAGWLVLMRLFYGFPFLSILSPWTWLPNGKYMRVSMHARDWTSIKVSNSCECIKQQKKMQCSPRTQSRKTRLWNEFFEQYGQSGIFFAFYRTNALWNVEVGGMQSVECKVWSSVRCKVWSVKCKVYSAERGV